MQGLGGHGAADTPAAVDDQGLVPLRQGLLHPNLQEPAGDEMGVLDVTLVPLALFPDVEKRPGLARLQPLEDLLGRHLFDLALHLFDEILKCCAHESRLLVT